MNGRVTKQKWNEFFYSALCNLDHTNIEPVINDYHCTKTTKLILADHCKGHNIDDPFAIAAYKEI